MEFAERIGAHQHVDCSFLLARPRWTNEKVIAQKGKLVNLVVDFVSLLNTVGEIADGAAEVTAARGDGFADRLLLG